MAEHRKVASETEARRMLAAVRASGLSIGEWSRSHGVDGRSLNAWRVNLGLAVKPIRRASKRSPTPSTQLVELVASSTRTARYAVHVGSTSVEFGDDFDTETLSRVVKLLRSC